MSIKPKVTFWFVIGYILAAFGWWTFAHIYDNARIQGLKIEILELQRSQAQRDIYANLLEQRFEGGGLDVKTVYVSGRAFAIDTNLVQSFMRVNYPDMEIGFQDNSFQIAVSQAAESNIKSKERSRNLMFIGEGLVFVSLLIWGFVTIFKGYKEKDELSHMQENFVMSVTHELKTPLASTKLMLQTLIKRKLSEEQTHKLVDNSLEEINRLDALIEKILMAARFENPQKHIHRRNINLSELCRDLVERLGQSNRLEGRLFNSIEDNVSVQGDVALLISVLTNLIENAGKYAVGSPVHVNLQLHNHRAILQVKDEGPGISDIDKRNIFKKFYRVGNEETRTAKGTGLGLYIVKNIISDMGGDIQVKDNQPKGAIFEITMPALEYEPQDTFS